MLPHLYRDLDNINFDGKNVVLSKVPYPKVNNENGCFYVLLDDIILDMLTFKIKCNAVPNHQESMNYVTSLHSKRLNAIFGTHFQSSPNKSCILVLLTLWSDRFDTNGIKKRE